MKTRFDDNKIWLTTNNAFSIVDMETDHLINTLKMFATKPSRVMSMLVYDIEHNPTTITAWSPLGDDNEIIEKSIYNATSMSADELTAYALNSPLGIAMTDELRRRGVNVDNVITMALNEVMK